MIHRPPDLVRATFRARQIIRREFWFGLLCGRRRSVRWPSGSWRSGGLAGRWRDAKPRRVLHAAARAIRRVNACWTFFLRHDFAPFYNHAPLGGALFQKPSPSLAAAISPRRAEPLTTQWLWPVLLTAPRVCLHEYDGNSSRTNSPACVDGDFPPCASRRARSMGV